MKNIVKLSVVLMFIILISITTSVYAASSCKITLNTTKDEFSTDEEFVVDVAVSNIQSQKGIIAMGASLEYDNDYLTLVKMEGQNGWATPSYNEDNGKLVTDRNSLSTSDESIFKITFKVKKAIDKELEIKLNNIAIADGDQETILENSSVTIKKATTTNAGQNNTTTETNKSNTITTTTVANKQTANIVKTVNNVDDSTQNKNLPFTGVRNSIIVFIIAILVINCIIIRKKLKK